MNMRKIILATAATTLMTGGLIATAQDSEESPQLAACYVGQGWSYRFPEPAVLDQQVSLRIWEQSGGTFTGVFEKTSGHGCTGEQTDDNFCHGLKFVGEGVLGEDNFFRFVGEDSVDDEANIALRGRISSGHQVGCDGNENLCAIWVHLNFFGAFLAPDQPLPGEKAFMTMTAVKPGSCPEGTPDP